MYQTKKKKSERNVRLTVINKIGLINLTQQLQNTHSFQVYLEHLPDLVIHWTIKKVIANLRMKLHNFRTLWKNNLQSQGNLITT